MRLIPFLITLAGIPANILNEPIEEKSLFTRLLDATMLSSGITEPFDIVVLFPTQTISNYDWLS